MSRQVLAKLEVVAILGVLGPTAETSKVWDFIVPNLVKSSVLIQEIIRMLFCDLQDVAKVGLW